MRDKLKDKKIYFIYTILFILIACMVFSTFIVHGRTFIWKSDGIKQHYIILKDFNERVRNFINSPKDGLDLFSWNMGLGLDVVGQYSYYILGDPFAYISLLFPMEKLEMAYNFLILLRLFFVGISFIVYARHHKKSQLNILLGAIIYTFCSFSLFAGVRHPYFLNAMALFPMLLLGVDKLFEENKKVFLCVWVAISAISNYYFFYMHTVMIVIYAIIKFACEYKKEGIKFFFKKLFSGALSFIIGILIAGIILLPTIYAFFNSARSGEDTICRYAEDYYNNLFSINLLTAHGNNWSYIGVSSIILIMLPVLFSKIKENKTFFWYFIILTVFLLVPFLGSAMNGFSFPNNRWSFIYCFVLAYIVTSNFKTEYTKKEFMAIGIFIAAYTVLGVILNLDNLSEHKFIIFLIQIVIAILMFVLLICANRNKNNCADKSANKRISLSRLVHKKETYLGLICFMVIINIGVMAYGIYCKYDLNYAKNFIKVGKVNENIATQLGKNEDYSESIKKVLKEDKGFYRIAKLPHEVQNYSVYYGYPSTECFFSIGNGYVYDLNRELADCRYSTTCNVRGIGDRTKITTLLGTKYYITDEKHEPNVPYSYSLKETIENVKIYENTLPLSIGNSYSTYMLRKDYEKLNPVEKEEAITKAVLVEDEDVATGMEKFKIEDAKSSCYYVPYKLSAEADILSNEQKIEIAKKNQTVQLIIPKVENAELYVFINGFKFEGDSKHVITANLNERSVSKTIDNKLTSAYFQSSPELLLPLGYYKEVEGEIQLSFSAKGVYDFKDIQVIAVPMNTYEQTIKSMQKNELKDVSYANGELKGKVSVDAKSILQISTSYSDGWKAYVDGQETKVIRVNTAFIGVPIEEGEHEIVFKYETPYLKLGIVCSLIGIILLGVEVVFEKRLLDKNRS